MILALIVWLVMSVIPAVSKIAIVIIFVMVVSGVIGIVRKLDFHEPSVWDWTRKQLRWAIPVVLLAAFMPSERTAWYMVGAYATQTVAQSETAKQFAGDGVDVLHSLMKKAKEKIDNYDAEDAPKEVKAK